MKKILSACFVVGILMAPQFVFAHISDEPHEELPIATVPSQTPVAFGGFLVGVAVGMIFTKFLLAKKDES